MPFYTAVLLCPLWNKKFVSFSFTCNFTNSNNRMELRILKRVSLFETLLIVQDVPKLDWIQTHLVLPSVSSFWWKKLLMLVNFWFSQDSKNGHACSNLLRLFCLDEGHFLQAICGLCLKTWLSLTSHARLDLWSSTSDLSQSSCGSILNCCTLFDSR